MTKNQKKFLVILLVLVLLYIASVVLGLSNHSSKSNQDPKNYPWTSVLNNLLEPFAPRVNLSALSCNGSKVSSQFALNANQESCTLKIPNSALGDQDFWKTDIILSATNKPKPDVYFKAKYTKDAKRESPPDPSCIDAHNATVPSGFWLAVELTPADEKEIFYRCWLKANDNNRVGITLVGPSTVEIGCHGCTEENQRTIQLRFK